MVIGGTILGAWVHRLVAALTACLALATSPVSATNVVPIEKADSVRVVFGGDRAYAPFHFVDKNGQPAGFDVELFEAVARQSGLRVQYRFDQWDRILAGLRSGAVDVAPMLVSSERSRWVLFTEPFLDRYHLAFGHRGSAYIREIGELKGKRVALQRAGMAWEALAKIPNITRVEVPVEADAVKAVADGRADYALVPSFIGYTGQKRHNLQQTIVPLSAPMLEAHYAFAVSKHRPELVARINAGIRHVTQHGELNDAYIQWLSNLTPPEDSYRSGLMSSAWLIASLLVLAGVLLVWWRRAAIGRAREAQFRMHAETHDPVTRLMNRGALRRGLEVLIEKEQPFCVIRIDLLNIQAMEAAAGPTFVEKLLSALAERLRQRHELVATISDRGFALAAPGIETPAQASDLMRCIVSSINERVDIADLPIEQSACAGAALYPAQATDAEALMQASSAACEIASLVPGNTVVFQPDLAPSLRRITLLADLRAALRARSIGYALQAKLCLSTRRTCGAEMLVRWEHPTHGLLQPQEFITMAEQAGIIGTMTLMFVEAAIEHARHLLAHGIFVPISVNVSANDLSDRQVVDEIIRMAADAYGLLVLEVTETAVMRDPEQAFAAVARLREGGVRISLDDFGTGNSSLTYLRRLAPDEVKIDRSFVVDLARSSADRSIVTSTIDLAHSLGAMVTAEGVEDRETMLWLDSVGCDSIQGFYFAYPTPPLEFVSAVLAEAQSA